MKNLIPILLLAFSESILAEEVWSCNPFLFPSEEDTVIVTISDSGDSGTIQVFGVTQNAEYGIEGLNRLLLTSVINGGIINVSLFFPMSSSTWAKHALNLLVKRT